MEVWGFVSFDPTNFLCVDDYNDNCVDMEECLETEKDTDEENVCEGWEKMVRCLWERWVMNEEDEVIVAYLY